MCEDDARVVVLDDDPTGSQTASGVRVLLRPDLEATRRWIQTSERAVYVVTNTRAMSEQRAVAVLSEYLAGLAAMSAEERTPTKVVLRGDSTLRGHVCAEIGCLASESSITLFVPAFPDGHRITIDSTHLLRVNGRDVPVAETEFARDPVFGYQDSFIPDWFAARSPGTRVLTASLATVRGGPEKLARVLCKAPAGTVVVPDIETTADVDIVVAALRVAEASGRLVNLRGAAPIVALRAGVHSLGSLPSRAPGHVRTLVVCGSHTQASTDQLTHLRNETGVREVELPARAELPTEVEVPEAAARLRQILREDGLALLSTARTRPSDLATLDDGAGVMSRLTGVAALVSEDVDACVVKGGITSADVAARSFDAIEAMVVGQLETGVSLWRLKTRQREIDYVVVPGNMGDNETLVRCVDAVTSRERTTAVPPEGS